MNTNPDKIDLIDYTYDRCQPVPHSFADLGGIWGVDGAYTFHTLREHGAERAFLVDTHFTDAALEASHHEQHLTLVRGDFGQDEVASRIGSVDLILLFDVLLHQVKPNWNEILETYSKRATYLAIYNQQWTGSGRTVRLLDLGHDEYFRNVPHTEGESPYDELFAKMDELHPEYKRAWRDIHNVWQWGITDHDLLQTMEDLGYKLQYYMNCGRFGSLPNFENHGFVFQKT